MDTELPRGNVHERDSGSVRGAIPGQPLWVVGLGTPPGSTTPTLFE